VRVEVAIHRQVSTLASKPTFSFHSAETRVCSDCSPAGYPSASSRASVPPHAALPQAFRLRLRAPARPLTDNNPDRDPARRENRIRRPRNHGGTSSTSLTTAIQEPMPTAATSDHQRPTARPRIRPARTRIKYSTTISYRPAAALPQASRLVLSPTARTHEQLADEVPNEHRFGPRTNTATQEIRAKSRLAIYSP
jgi:hypothetical protein